MKKKILAITTLLVITVVLTTPVFAVPTAGQKVAVTITWSKWTVVTQDPITTPGGIVQNRIEGTWDVEIAIDGGPTYTGTSDTIRYLTVVPKEGGADLVLKEIYDISIDSESGGFEGSGLIIIKVWIPPAGPYEKAKAHGLLHGTGSFEGQTINAGHSWVPPGPIQWMGYLLKPSP